MRVWPGVEGERGEKRKRLKVGNSIMEKRLWEEVMHGEGAGREGKPMRGGEREGRRQ